MTPSPWWPAFRAYQALQKWLASLVLPFSLGEKNLLPGVGDYMQLVRGFCALCRCPRRLTPQRSLTVASLRSQPWGVRTACLGYLG